MFRDGMRTVGLQSVLFYVSFHDVWKRSVRRTALCLMFSNNVYSSVLEFCFDGPADGKSDGATSGLCGVPHDFMYFAIFSFSKDCSISLLLRVPPSFTAQYIFLTAFLSKYF